MNTKTHHPEGHAFGVMVFYTQYAYAVKVCFDSLIV